MVKSSISVSGTSQRLREPRWKPRSSSGLSRAGTKGSVAEATMVAPMANAQPAREALKYGQTRAILRESVSLAVVPTVFGFVD